MTAVEYQRLVTKLGLGSGPLDAAPFFGVDPRTASRWWYDERSIPMPAAKLLRLAVKHNIDPKRIIDL